MHCTYGTNCTVGIQLWNHGDYSEYKCLGPYTSKWGCCSASWHPSILGHELRAGHYSFFWLSIMKDALTTILDTIKDEDAKKIDDLFVSTMRHVHHERKYVTSRPLFESPYSDNMQCLTSFHPIADPNANLEKILIKNNLTPELQAFKKIIFEDLLEKGIATRARERGYKDYKYMFYGNNQSIPLSMKITINQVGVSFICQPPGVWGRYPGGFKSMWENASEIYLTKNVGVEK